jgi:hypothetical protein
LAILLEKVDIRFQEGHLRLALALRLLARPFPEVQHLLKGLDVGGVLFADADVPRVVLADVYAQRVRPHRDADADVAVTQQQSFEEIRRRLRAD